MISSHRLAATVIAALAIHAPSTVEAQRPVTARAEVRINGDANTLNTVAGISVSARGDIAVLQQTDNTVRIFDADGRSVKTIGRDGAGPGEFRAVSQAGWFGDTLWVADGRLRRITVFDPAGDASTIQMPGRISPPGNITVSALFPVSLARDRSVIALMSGRADNAEISQYVRLNRGAYANAVTTLPAGDGMMVSSPAGVTAYFHQPFKRTPIDAVSRDGGAVAIVDASLDGPGAGTFEIRMFGSDGKPLYTRTHRFPAVKLPKRVADSAVAADLDRIRGYPLAKELAAEYRQELKIPSVYPPFTRVFFADDGTLWIELRETAEGRPYMRFDRKGELTGTIIFPRGTEVKTARGATAWAVQLDEYDVPSIVRFSVPIVR